MLFLGGAGRLNSMSRPESNNSGGDLVGDGVRRAGNQDNACRRSKNRRERLNERVGKKAEHC